MSDVSCGGRLCKVVKKYGRPFETPYVATLLTQFGPPASVPFTLWITTTTCSSLARRIRSNFFAFNTTNLKEPVAETVEPPTPVVTYASSVEQPARLDPRMTFDSFVPGPSNRLAFAAAQSVAETPGR